MKKDTIRQVDDRGFTLIEVVIGVVILTLGLLAIASMQLNSIRGNAFARDFTEASSVASTLAERAMVTPYDSLTTSTETVGGYTAVSTVEAQDIDGDGVFDLKKIDIVVSWSVGGNSHSITIESYRSKGDPS